MKGHDHPVTTALAGDRYELGEVVGTGGMSQVRRATDLVLGRQVAVKIFRDDLDDDSAARARIEMQTLARLSHPRLVAVHDAGTWESGQPYLVMELIEGPTLAASVLTPEQVASVGADLAEALAYVHDNGIVHRDVKPANVLLAPDGAKLADFGIARIIDSARHTGTGLTIGTAPYLSPEQVTGGAITPAVDIYSLGLVMLECLTGHREYDGSPVEAALARLHREPVIPADLPEPWPALLREMTANSPEFRPGAREVAARLRGNLAGPATTVMPAEAQTSVLRSGLPTPPPTRIPRVVTARRPWWRQPVGMACLAAGVLLLLALLVSLGSGGSSGTPQPRTTTTPTTVTPLEQHIADLQNAVGR